MALNQNERDICLNLLGRKIPTEEVRIATEEFIKARIEIDEGKWCESEKNAIALLREGKIEESLDLVERWSDDNSKKIEALMAILQAIHDNDPEVASEGRYNGDSREIVLHREANEVGLWWAMIQKRAELRLKQEQAEAAIRKAGGDVEKLFNEANAVGKLSVIAAILDGVAMVKKIAEAGRQSGLGMGEEKISRELGVEEGKRRAAGFLSKIMQAEAAAKNGENEPQNGGAGVPKDLRKRVKKAATEAHPDKRASDDTPFKEISSAFSKGDLAELHLALTKVERRGEITGVTPEIVDDLKRRIEAAGKVPEILVAVQHNIAQRDKLLMQVQELVDYLGQEVREDVFLHIPPEHRGLARELFERFGIKVFDPMEERNKIHFEKIIINNPFFSNLGSLINK